MRREACVLILLQGAAAFITSAGKHLPLSDIWCILYPSLRHFLKSDLVVIDEQSLLMALKSPVSSSPLLVLFKLFAHRHIQLGRDILQASVQWAMKGEKSSFWKAPRRITQRIESPRESVISMRKTVSSGIGKNKTEE